MVLFNYALKELTAKIVYYGPGLSGKTTNLKYIYEEVPVKNKGRMLTLATETDRTLYFDFLPVEAGVVRGIKTRVQLYTVPGQVFYNATRRMVLKGADGVVFVADSQKTAMAANQQSWDSLLENLKAHDLDLDSMPMVLQYNKRDLDDVYTVEEMNDQLNEANAPFYEAVANEGVGVQDTLQAISGLVLNKVIEKYGGPRPNEKAALFDKSKPSSQRNKDEESTTKPDVSSEISALTAELDQLVGDSRDEGDQGGSEGAGLPAPEDTDQDEAMAHKPDTDKRYEDFNLEGILDEALKAEDEPEPKQIPEPIAEGFSFPDLLEEALGDDRADGAVVYDEPAKNGTTDGVNLASELSLDSLTATVDVLERHSSGKVEDETQDVAERVPSKLDKLSETQFFTDSGDVDPSDALAALESKLESLDSPQAVRKQVEVPVNIELAAGEEEVELQIVLKVKVKRGKQ